MGVGTPQTSDPNTLNPNFSEQADGVTPNVVTLNTAISTCSKVGYCLALGGVFLSIPKKP